VGRYGTLAGGRNLNDEAVLWPTPNVPNGGRVNPPGTSPTGMAPDGSKKQIGLENAVKLWPTPRAGEGDKWSAGSQRDDSLQQQSRLWATPTARDHRSIHAGPATLARNSRPLSEQVGAAHSLLAQPTPADGPSICGERRTLNPLFVEALMGWPIGWTGFAFAATEWSRWSRRMRCELSRLSWPGRDGVDARGCLFAECSANKK
jgi:hypothetical protein